MTPKPTPSHPLLNFSFLVTIYNLKSLEFNSLHQILLSFWKHFLVLPSEDCNHLRSCMWIRCVDGVAKDDLPTSSSNVYMKNVGSHRIMGQYSRGVFSESHLWLHFNLIFTCQIYDDCEKRVLPRLKDHIFILQMKWVSQSFISLYGKNYFIDTMFQGQKAHWIQNPDICSHHRSQKGLDLFR